MQIISDIFVKKIKETIEEQLLFGRVTRKTIFNKLGLDPEILDTEFVEQSKCLINYHLDKSLPIYRKDIIKTFFPEILHPQDIFITSFAISIGIANNQFPDYSLSQERGIYREKKAFRAMTVEKAIKYVTRSIDIIFLFNQLPEYRSDRSFGIKRTIQECQL